MWSKRVVIWCDSCSEHKEVHESSVIRAEKAIKEAGWTKIESGIHCCPDCDPAEAEEGAKKMEEQLQERWEAL